MTVVLVLLTALVALALVVSGPLARAAGELLGVGETAVAVWSVARWPLLALVVSQLIAFLYWLLPNVPQPGYR